MARDIKTRLTLEGANEFKKGMADAASAIKVLNSEQKLADATFKATGDSEQYLTQKTDILRRKMQEQVKAVEAAQAAIAKLSEGGMDANSREMQTWQMRLNNANAALQSMQAELNNTESELREQGSAMEEAGNKADNLDQKIGNIGKTISFQTVIDGLTRVKDKLEAIIKTAAGAAKALWDMETGAGKWADDLITNASKAGTDVETYQAMEYASRFVDTEVETIFAMRRKLLDAMEKAMEPPKETKKGGITLQEFNDAQQAFARLGVSVTDDAGKMRDALTVFYEVIDALGKIDDANVRDSTAMDLLGKKAQEVNPLIDAGSRAYANYVKEGREVAVVSEENVKALGDLNDAQNKLEAMLDKTKYETLAQLAPLFTQVTEAMSAAVQGFNDFLKTEEGQNAMQTLADALKSIINSFTEQDFKGVVDTATGAVQALTGALSWLSENGGAVKAAIIGIGAAIGVLNIATAGLRIAQLVNGLKGLLGGGGGGATPTPTTSSTPSMPIAQPSSGTPATRDTSPVFRDTSPVMEPRQQTQMTGKELIASGAAALAKLAGPVAGVAIATVVSKGLEGRHIAQTYGEADRIAEATDKIESLGDSAALLKESIEVYKREDARETYDFLTGRRDEINAILGHDPVSDRAATYAEGFNGWKGIDVYTADLAKVIEDMKAALVGKTGGSSAENAGQLFGEAGKQLEDMTRKAEEAKSAALEAQAAQFLQDIETRKAASEAAEAVTETGDGMTERFEARAHEMLDELIEEREALEETAVEAAETAAEPTGIDDLSAKFDQMLADLHNDLAEIVDNTTTEVSDIYHDSVARTFGQAGQQLDAEVRRQQDALEASMAATKAQVERDLLGITDEAGASAEAAGEVYGPMMAQGIDSGAGAPVTSAQTMNHGVVAELQKPAADAQDAGANVPAGLAAGIVANASAATGAALELANAVQATVRRALAIFSPSRVMAQLGKYTALGFAEGMEGETWRIEEASGRMAAAAASEPIRGSKGGRRVPGADQGGQAIRNVIVIDGRVMAESLTPYVGDEMAAEMRISR